MIDNEIGKYFPLAFRTVGYVLLVLGLIFVFGSPLLGIGLALAGSAIAFSISGVQIDRASQKIRDYTEVLRIKIGSWEPLTGYSDIAVLRKRITTTAFSRANRPATTSDEVVFDICLLDKTHRMKRIIQRLHGQDAAVDRAKELSELLGLNYGPYNPVISAATRARRR